MSSGAKLALRRGVCTCAHVLGKYEDPSLPPSSHPPPTHTHTTPPTPWPAYRGRWQCRMILRGVGARNGRSLASLGDPLSFFGVLVGETTQHSQVCAWAGRRIGDSGVAGGGARNVQGSFCAGTGNSGRRRHPS